MNTAKELRTIAIETLQRREIMQEIEEKIYLEAEKGRGYLKIGFPFKHIKLLEEECKKNEIKFINQGNDHSGSSLTTVYLDWSINGDGMILISDLNNEAKR